MSTVGVTGATGFMGSLLVRRLADLQDSEVRALTRTIAPALPRDPRIEWTQGDLSSYRDCVAFVAGLDAVVHLAHTNTPYTSNQHLPSDAAMNIVPLLTLIQAIRDAGTRPHVIYASTGGALYRVEGRRPLTEASPVEPTTSYGIQKFMGEHYLRLATHEGWITATVLRIGNPYGVLLPRQRLQGFIGVALSQILEGGPVRIFGDADNVRDFVHLDDVMRMFELAVARREGFDVYNVGSGVGRSVRSVLALLHEFSGVDAEVIYEPPTTDSRRLPAWIVLDIGKARQELGWRPKVEFETGLRAMCEQAVAAL
ncbi:MAG: NAD-dependent epimerase/dehydratase family protein [Actinomycetota bacterium]